MSPRLGCKQPMLFLTAEHTIRDLCAAQRHGYHPVLWPSVAPNAGVNGLEWYDAVRAAYSSLDSRSVSCRAIEMLGRALVAQIFVTASLGAVFSLEFAIDLYRDRSPGSLCDVTSGLTATGKEKVRGGRCRFMTAFFTRKTDAKIQEKRPKRSLVTIPVSSVTLF